jgi:hypothetical protein
MARPIDSPRHKALRDFLVEKRKEAGLRQVDLAKRLKRRQDYVSYVETGPKQSGLGFGKHFRGPRTRDRPREPQRAPRIGLRYRELILVQIDQGRRTRRRLALPPACVQQQQGG